MIYNDPTRNKLAQQILSEFQKLSLFEQGDVDELGNGLIDIRMEYLVEKTGAKDEAEANRILRRLNAMGLLRGLTIDYDHSKWMKHSRIKGCLVVNVCIVKSDYAKKGLEKKVASVILDLRKKILRGFKKGILKHIFIIPNAHLAPSNELGGNPEKEISILKAIKEELIGQGFDVVLNSYGYAKDIVEAINAYKGGYVFRNL
jgi:hypothetical protein